MTKEQRRMMEQKVREAVQEEVQKQFALRGSMTPVLSSMELSDFLKLADRLDLSGIEQRHHIYMDHHTDQPPTPMPEPSPVHRRSKSTTRMDEKRPEPINLQVRTMDDSDVESYASGQEFAEMIQQRWLEEQQQNQRNLWAPSRSITQSSTDQVASPASTAVFHGGKNTIVK